MFAIFVQTDDGLHFHEVTQTLEEAETLIKTTDLNTPFPVAALIIPLAGFFPLE